jgi:predicted transcriptional regulator
MSAIPLQDLTETQLKDLTDLGLLGRVGIYRFDVTSKQHVLDTIALVKTPTFPRPVPVFNEVEPKQDSLEGCKKWEGWRARKDAYEMSDYPQMELVFKKLLSVSDNLSGSFESLLQTLREMRVMGEEMHSTFEGVPLRHLRKIVESIPQRIKEVAKKLQESSGIVIRDHEGGLKLTTEFLKKMDVKEHIEDQRESESEAKMKEVKQAESGLGEVVGLPNPNGTLTMGGVPMDVLIPLLKTSYISSREAARVKRMTM